MDTKQILLYRILFIRFCVIKGVNAAGIPENMHRLCLFAIRALVFSLRGPEGFIVAHPARSCCGDMPTTKDSQAELMVDEFTECVRIQECWQNDRAERFEQDEDKRCKDILSQWLDSIALSNI